MNKDVFTSGMYTIDGKKVNATDRMHKGIYIKDGKKIIVK